MDNCVGESIIQDETKSQMQSLFGPAKWNLWRLLYMDREQEWGKNFLT